MNPLPHPLAGPIRPLPTFARLLATAFLSCLLAVPSGAIDLPLLDDAHIIQSAASINYGGSPNLGVVSTSGSQRYSFLRFSVHQDLPEGTTGDDIAQAWLFLYINTATTPGKMLVHKVTGPLWISGTSAEGKSSGGTPVPAGTITWNNSNGVSAVALTTPDEPEDFTGYSANEYVAIDVTTLVKSWLAAPAASNYGLVLKPTGQPGESVNLVFDSKENTDTSHAPKLQVTLLKVGPQGLKGDKGDQGNPGNTPLPITRIAPQGDLSMGTFTNGTLP